MRESGDGQRTESNQAAGACIASRRKDEDETRNQDTSEHAWFDGQFHLISSPYSSMKD